ncbi:MAG: carboxypeptidase-like regulatory domain-containing protein [Dysgonamonadaceae bacterium]|jgi:hypothetical protein|nr:carboxypeptidase-like regulatory domain-containing protein [Dysgonamonadaceae bacterium]
MNLKDYIQGKRSGKEANRLERQAQENPFLHDAIDGFDSIAGNHLSAIENLEKELNNRLQKPRKKTVALKWRIIAVAASFALLIGIGSLLLFQPNFEEIHIAESTETVLDKENEILTAEAVQDSDYQNRQTNILPPIPPPPISEILEIVEHEVESRIELAEAVLPPSPPMSPSMILEIMEDATIEITESAVMLRQREVSQPVNESIIAQGQVVDEFGEPVIGATITLGSSTKGTATDIDGNFRLTIPAELKNENITIAYIGFQSQQLVPEQDMTIKMQEDNALLSEVVVIGYGVQRRESRSINARLVEFGEKEFELWLKENIDRTVCAVETIDVTLRFRIDENGKPTNIQLVRINCEEIRQEILDLLENSPEWTRKNRNVRLRVRLSEL